MDLSKAKHDAMENMAYSTNNKAKQKTNFVCVHYVKIGSFWKMNTASAMFKISLPNLQGTPGIGQI